MVGDGDEPRVRDGEDGALSLFLGILHLVDVLRDAGVISPPCGYGRIEGDDVIGLGTTAAGS